MNKFSIIDELFLRSVLRYKIKVRLNFKVLNDINNSNYIWINIFVIIIGKTISKWLNTFREKKFLIFLVYI